MALATWWRGDPDMDFMSIPDFRTQPPGDDEELARINHLGIGDIRERRRAGHHPYVGYIGETAVTYGWVATRTAEIGELSLVFALPAGDRYLWDFATLPEWQGKGLYPRLLHAIVRMEDADRFWILPAPEDPPSGVGIEKGGFHGVGQLSFRPDGSVALIPIDKHVRARFGAALLGLPLSEGEISPCWRCMDHVVCTCKLDPARCDCAVQPHPHR